ncbi:hypothetical protein [Pararhodobacter zhoushanensis]|uniref:hypothetical protein n=1 Tax=Pararhodobacter zhoushanensis TaxID=2479545 RepID=UPI000F8E9FAB|nr:hypothetical protein [Pararhodobacter zhoushanensis]
MLEILPKSGGAVSRVKATCYDCQRGEVIPCEITRGSGGVWSANEGQAHAKLRAQGWSIVKGKLRCMTCEAKRKAGNAPPVPVAVQAVAGTDKGPTREQKREILELLQVSYDADAGRYRGADTDGTVAEAVRGALPGWVADLRAEFFGEGGGNEAAGQYADDLAALRQRCSDAFAAVEADFEALKGKVDQVRAVRDDLAKLEVRFASLAKSFDRRVGAKVGGGR